MAKERNKYTFCIDFDGTIVKYAFPEIGEPVPYALDVLKELQEEGHKLILYTIRSDKDADKDPTKNYLTQAINYLEENGIVLYGVNYNKQQKIFSNSPKTYAHYYIDDLALGTPLIKQTTDKHPYVDWLSIKNILQNNLKILLN